MIIVGIDIGKEQFDAMIVWETGKKHHHTFANDRKGVQAFKRWLKRHKVKQAHIGMEATGYCYLPLADFVHEMGYSVSLINPHRIKAYADSQLRRNKTDKLDAELIAEFCRTQQPDHWTPPNQAMRQFLALVRRYDDLTEAVQQERNRLQAGIPSHAVLLTIQDHIAFLEQQLKQIICVIHIHRFNH